MSVKELSLRIRDFAGRYKDELLVAITIFIIFAILGAFDINCPIRLVTGVSCAGCGMTRAWLAALRLDFAEAFSFHPLFPVMIPAVLLFIIRKKMPKWLPTVLAAVFLILFTVVYMYRLMDSTDAIVVFEPRSGLIGRLYEIYFSC